MIYELHFRHPLLDFDRPACASRGIANIVFPPFPAVVGKFLRTVSSDPQGRQRFQGKNNESYFGNSRRVPAEPSREGKIPVAQDSRPADGFGGQPSPQAIADIGLRNSGRQGYGFVENPVEDGADARAYGYSDSHGTGPGGTFHRRHIVHGL